MEHKFPKIFSAAIWLALIFCLVTMLIQDFYKSNDLKQDIQHNEYTYYVDEDKILLEKDAKSTVSNAFIESRMNTIYFGEPNQWKEGVRLSNLFEIHVIHDILDKQFNCDGDFMCFQRCTIDTGSLLNSSDEETFHVLDAFYDYCNNLVLEWGSSNHDTIKNLPSVSVVSLLNEVNVKDDESVSKAFQELKEINSSNNYDEEIDKILFFAYCKDFDSTKDCVNHMLRYFDMKGIYPINVHCYGDQSQYKQSRRKNFSKYIREKGALNYFLLEDRNKPALFCAFFKT